PGRWASTAVIAVLAAMFVHMLATNDRFQWSFMVHNMFRGPILRGAEATLLLTVFSMLIGIALGIVIAIMRLSENPILKSAAWLYTWFFRAIPRYVLLTVVGNLGFLYPRLRLGLPFTDQISGLLGLDVHGTIWSVNANNFYTGFRAALLGLALSEAAYMAEIVRAGILAVDPGQMEAAQSLGMGRTLALRRIVLPQAMRVIVPPTGNETIAMLKDTSLVVAVPVSIELFFQLEAVGHRTFNVFPMYIAAVLWYLALSSVLMVGQYFLERRFGRGFDQRGNSGSRSVALSTGQQR
ncbi:MAG: polar amino acid transport system permease protein, partial [Frankiaceae bacterium]|nr:polar amino acid transport system permease protein [Frankiaceae bacterium]